MDENEALVSRISASEEKSDSFYPMCFGVSCAFFALKILSDSGTKDERWHHIFDKMLQGSAQLLGLLVWRVQKANEGNFELLHKLEFAKKEVEELKRIRSEDAKANEKVVGIFNSQEQCWLSERKQLRQQIEALLNDLRVLEKNKTESVSELNDKLKEMEITVHSKDKVLEEEAVKRKELEEKLKEAENLVEELKETAKREAQEHSSEIWKHKSAFVELVSNQRRLEAEMGRALRQAEAAKQELSLVLEQKEDSVSLSQKLSMEVMKTRKDLEQKEKILSAMLRKAKLDMAGKQMLLKELQLSKAKRKQSELETERWRAMYESRYERHTSRSTLASRAKSKMDVVLVARGVHSNSTGLAHSGRSGLPLHDHGIDEFSPLPDPCTLEENEELVEAEVKHFESTVHTEVEKYAAAAEQRHHLELDAFAEEMRTKDEKLEAFRWKILSTELELKRLKSHVDGVNQDVSQLRHDNMKLEALLLEREEELDVLKEQVASQSKIISFNSSPPDPSLAHDTIWSKAKIIKKGPREKGHEKTRLEILPQETEKKEQNISSAIQSLEKESKETKGLPCDPSSAQAGYAMAADMVNNLDMPNQLVSKTNNTQSKLDLHALGISYKIKRLKQQLLMVERLMGKQESGEIVENHENGLPRMKNFLSLMSLLNKQVSRYQSLQGKADNLCKRMQENNLDANRGSSSAARSKGETRILEQFLEETFQLQRYIVATGQKLMEIQSRVSSELVGNTEELDVAATFDVNKFADSVKALSQEVQRGLEVRIARVIGDLEGTLACEGMIRLRRQ